MLPLQEGQEGIHGHRSRGEFSCSHLGFQHEGKAILIVLALEVDVALTWPARECMKRAFHGEGMGGGGGGGDLKG